MVENIVVSKIGSESDDRKTFSSTHSWSKNGSNLIVYLNNIIKEKDEDYSVLDENTITFSSSLKNSDQVSMVITNFQDPSNHKEIDDRMYDLDRLTKKSEGKAQTSIEKRPDEEAFVSQNIITASQIWIDEISSDPEQAKEDGVVEYKEKVRLYEDATVPNKKGWYASENENLENRLLEWVDPRFGQKYYVRLFDSSGKEVPTSDPINWNWDYYAGYLTIQNSDHNYNLPFRISGYVYIGEKALDQLATWKEPVFSTDFLPIYHNDDGDIRLILTENVFYRFDAIANIWRPLNYGSDTLRNPVTSRDNLPRVNNSRGDLRLVVEDNDLFVWDDTAGEEGDWILLTGQSFSPDNYYKKDVLDEYLSSKAAAQHEHDSIYYRKNEIDSFIRWRPSRASYSDLPPYTENMDGDVILTRDTNTIYRWVTEDPNEGQGHWTAIVESNFTWKGPVDSYDDLPLGSNNPGDVRLSRGEGKPYWWDGTTWTELKSTVAEHNHDDLYILKSDLFWKPPVNTYDDLPLVDNVDGDIRLVLDDNFIYKWDAHNYKWTLISQESAWKDPISNLSQLPTDNNENNLIFVKETAKVYYWDAENNIWNPIENKDHDHDDRYYKKESINALFDPQSGHAHDGVYSKAIDYNNLLNIPHFHWGVPVLNKEDLPSEGDERGDARIVLNDRALYVWTGSEWYLIVTGKFVMEHDHDDRYYTTEDVDDIISSEVSSLTAQIAGKANQVHNHDDLYYGKDYIDDKFDPSGGHSHNGSNSRKIDFYDLTGIPDFSKNHTHDQYYSKTELQTPGESSIHWDNITDAPGFSSNWESPVQNLEDLPESGNQEGDIRIVLNDKQLYEWDGSQWIYAGDWEVATTSYWKEPVDTESDLPVTNNIDGDVRLALKDNILFRWSEGTQQWYSISSQDGSSAPGSGGSVYLSGNLARESAIMSEGETMVTINTSYRPGTGDLMLWWNGLLQEVNEDYFEIDSYTINLAEGADEGDVIFVLIFLTEEIGALYTKEDHIATTDQKTFILDYEYSPDADHLLVYYNGQLQKVNDDYVEIDSNTIEMIDPCIEGEKLTFMAFNASLFSGGGTVQNACDVELGVPPDGSWSDGLFPWGSNTTSCKAFDDINEALVGLVTSKPSTIDDTKLIGIEERFTGFISNGNSNVEDSVGVEKDYLTKDGEFYLYTANNSLFGADKGTLRLYINNTLMESFNLGNAFIETYRAYDDGQQSGKYGLQEYGAVEDVGHTSEDGIRDSENRMLTIMFVSKYEQYTPEWQYGKARINVTPDLLQSGYNEIYLIHQTAEKTNQTQTYKVFFDDAPTQPEVSNISIDENSLKSTRYLSGVRYYSIDDVFSVDLTINNLFDNTYSTKPVEVGFSGIENFDIEIENLEGVSNIPTIGDTVEYNNSIILNEYNTYTIDAKLDVMLKNPFDEYYYTSESKNMLINTYSGSSSDKEENFYDEIYRLPIDDYDSTPSNITNQWDSLNELNENDALLFDGKLQYANLNFNDYYPLQAVDYSTYISDQYYIRAFKDSTPHNNGKILLQGINKDLLLNQKIIVDIKLPGQTGWLSLNKKYDPSSFDGEDDDGCLVDVDGEFFYYTSGTYSTVYSGKMIIVRIKLSSDSPSISTIKIWSD